MIKSLHNLIKGQYSMGYFSNGLLVVFVLIVCSCIILVNNIMESYKEVISSEITSLFMLRRNSIFLLKFILVIFTSIAIYKGNLWSINKL